MKHSVALFLIIAPLVANLRVFGDEPTVTVLSRVGSTRALHYIDDALKLDIVLENRSSGTITVGDISSADWSWREIKCDKLPAGWTLRHQEAIKRGATKPQQPVSLRPGGQVVMSVDLRDIFREMDLRATDLSLKISILYVEGTAFPQDDSAIKTLEWNGHVTLPVAGVKESSINF